MAEKGTRIFAVRTWRKCSADHLHSHG